jgi:hypothetical protein
VVFIDETWASTNMARRHGQWNAIERLFDLCSPTERGNDFAHAGYGAD